MFFEYLKLDKEDFKYLLRSKKFDVIEVPIVDDYFSFERKPENGYIISVQAPLHKLIDIVFYHLRKSQITDILAYINHLDSLTNTGGVSFENKYGKYTLTFVFKDNKCSVFIENLLHVLVDQTDTIDLLLAGIHMNFEKSAKFDQFITLMEQKTQEYFKNTYNINYTVDNLASVRKIVHSQYNLNAPHYNESLNKNYDQQKVAKYMDEHYAAVMLSSTINKAKSLSILVTEPTVDMSRKINHDGKSYGIERVTFPVKYLKRTERLLDHILINEWSKKTMQMVNALMLYQSAINSLTVKHISLAMPKLQTEKKDLERFELFSVIGDAETYFNNSFKIIFGLDIQIQLKDGTDIIYDHTFKDLDEAYIHFIDYFRKRIIKRIPDPIINNNTFKLLSMMNI